MATFDLAKFLKEARRRRVFRFAAIYIVGAWISLQVADLAFPGFGIPESAIRYVWISAILGLPIALVFSWRYDIRDGRIVRTVLGDTNADLSIGRVDIVILGALLIVVTVIAFGLIGEISKTRVPETVPRMFVEINPNSIAVLPFVNMSEDPDNEYFADGISEEILNLLARFRELQVTSRSSAFSFKGQNVDVPTIAASLNVAHVLEGSVRKSGDQLRITAQLVEVNTDTHLWSETYDRKLENIFVVQDEIAAAVAQALRLLLLGDEPKVTDTDPEAYALYLQGRYFHNQQTEESSKRAENLLKQALEIDPVYVPALVELGGVYSEQADGGVRPIDEGNEMARRAFLNALDIDPQYGRAHIMLAMIEMFYDWDFATASRHAQQALELSPGDAITVGWAAYLEAILGRQDEAIELQRRSVTLDPVSPSGHRLLGRMLYWAGRLDEAAASMQTALSLKPDLWALQTHIGFVLLAQGDASAALRAVEQEIGPVVRLMGIAIVQHALGGDEASDSALQELTKKYADVAAVQIAGVYASRGEIDHAFDWLEQAYGNRDAGLPGIQLEPVLGNLHEDPRWDPLLDKIGLPH